MLADKRIGLLGMLGHARQFAIGTTVDAGLFRERLTQ